MRPQTRMDSGDSAGATDRKSGGPGPLLTLDAIAVECACSVWTVRSWVDAGKLKVLRLPGRLVRVRRSDLDAILEACR